MPVTKANAIVDGLHIEEADPDGDQDALERLAHWALKRYSPVIVTDRDGLMIDATGAAHLFGGEQSMLSDLISRLQEENITARAAMAPTYGAAHALARYGAGKIVIVTDTKSALFTLPVTALRLPAEIVRGLHLLGFETIGELCITPRAPLALRFGTELGRRLDQALGSTAEPIEPIMLPDVLAAQRIMAEPIATAESLGYCIRLLIEEIYRELEEKTVGARQLDLLFHRVDNRIEAIRISLAKPARDAKRITKLLTDKLETVDPGFGVEIIRLTVPWVEPLGYKQKAAGFVETEVADIASLVDTLSNRLQPGELYQTAPKESDVPERSFARTEHFSEITSPHKTCWPRPVRLLPRPEPIQTMALLPDYPPVSFTWRGTRHQVQRADGPERIFGEWWKRDKEIEAVRDYFRLENEEGERFWVYRSGDGIQTSTGSGKWFLHGFFG